MSEALEELLGRALDLHLDPHDLLMFEWFAKRQRGEYPILNMPRTWQSPPWRTK